MTSRNSSSGARILDGRALAKTLKEEVRREVDQLRVQGKRAPGLAIILVGDDPASHVYVRNKSKACRATGIEYFDHPLPADTSRDALLELIGRLNDDARVDGILIQLPLPGALHDIEAEITAAVDPSKDVDGFHLENVALLQLGQPRFVPCTPAGIMTMLEHTGISVQGSRATVVGRSAIVGKPAAALLLQNNATVTQCHSKTRALDEEVARADILIAAVGRAHLIRGDWIKPGAVVIDVGMNRLDGRLCGDVDFSEARKRAEWITPVPGGVGPMTIASLMKNCLKARLLHGD